MGTLRRGGIVCMATDTVYGLHCDAGSEEAVSRLRGLKGGAQRPFIVLVSETAALDGIALPVSTSAKRLVEAYWPGPLTVLLRASQGTPKWLLGPGGTVAVRCPGRSPCVPVLRRMDGPVVSTSANTAGGEPCLTGEEAAQSFLDKVDVVVDTGPAPSAVSSTIVDVTVSPHKVVRQGDLAVSVELLVAEP